MEFEIMVKYHSRTNVTAIKDSEKVYFVKMKS